MIIIVEGIDRVGKSTLCEMLQANGYKLLDAKIHTSKHTVTNCMYDKLQEERTVAQAQLLALLDKSEKIVIDRFHLSQIVYGCIDRGRDTRYHMLSLEELLIHNSLLVYIQPTNLENSSKEHGSDLSKHLSYFNELFKGSMLLKIKGSYDTLNDIVSFIKEVDNDNYSKHS